MLINLSEARYGKHTYMLETDIYRYINRGRVRNWIDRQAEIDIVKQKDGQRQREKELIAGSERLAPITITNLNTKFTFFYKR